MKKIYVAFLPLMFLGFLIPETGNQTEKVEMEKTTFDGPYILYSTDKVYVKTIVDDNGVKSIKVDSMAIADKAGITMTVATDEPGKTFSFPLKNNLLPEKSEYKKVNKQFILSDIEGNFAAFRKLLQAGGVIDANYNWTFGDGHLVLTGDFFDRGEQVTEVLWLIYSLEDKAKAAGGYVHYVLGNHEIMNMSGDLRYLAPKYVQNATLLGEDYMKGLYGENSEIGKWLRTKNIVEKVGNILFAHGGISTEINNYDLSLAKINEISQPYYGDSTYNYKFLELETIFGDNGPFWYRGYYAGNKLATQGQVDSTLEKFNVKYIATGHTIIADVISTKFKGKLIDTDVHHAKGHSEALLLEGGKFYRVTAAGERFPLA
jgi:hypothetical protein